MLNSAPTIRFASRPQSLRHRLAKRVRTLTGTDGGALVELSVTLPIIFLIMTGIFAFSIALYQKLALAEGISAGARTLATERGQNDPCGLASAAVYAAAPALTQGSFSFTFVLNGVKTTGPNCAGSGGAANANMVSGAAGSIAATYPCTIKVYNFSFPSCSLGSSVSEEIQ